jgi:hypothetical protein
VVVTLIKPGFPDGNHTPLLIVMKQPENIYGVRNPSQWPELWPVQRWNTHLYTDKRQWPYSASIGEMRKHIQILSAVEYRKK